MAETQSVISLSRLILRRRCVAHLLKCRLRSSLLVLFILLISHSTHANPWLPKKEGWKYNFEYSKYDTPRSIKFYETDMYFTIEKNKALLYGDVSELNKLYETQINNREAYLSTLYSQQQIVQNNIYANDPDIQILNNRLNNATQDQKNQISQLTQLQKYLITSYHQWGAKTSIEYGLRDNISYGMDIGGGREVIKRNAKTDINHLSVFVKNKLYDKKGVVFTLQTKVLKQGPMGGVDFTAMVGKSRKTKKKLFGKKVEFFGYTSFGMTKFLDDSWNTQKQVHAEITSGIKWNDSTIIVNQETEEFNPGLSKTYKRILKSKFTVAYDLNFASIEPRNKVYLALSYFTIDSLKAKRRLSSGYTLGLWLEL